MELMAQKGFGTSCGQNHGGHCAGGYAGSYDVVQHPDACRGGYHRQRECQNRNEYSVLTVTDIVSETNTQKTRNSMIGSVKKNGLTLEKLPDGFRATFEFPEYSYTIPMDFILVGDSLKVSVDTSKIIEKGEQRLFSLRILPYFGAQDWETDGYFILPDGSGSLLRFNNGKGRFTYRSDLYGLDGVVKQDSRTTNQQAAALPCFGIQTKKQGLLAVVEDGAGRAGIHASTSGGESQFNRAYAGF